MFALGPSDLKSQGPKRTQGTILTRSQVLASRSSYRHTTAGEAPSQFFTFIPDPDWRISFSPNLFNLALFFPNGKVCPFFSGWLRTLFCQLLWKHHAKTVQKKNCTNESDPFSGYGKFRDNIRTIELIRGSFVTVLKAVSFVSVCPFNFGNGEHGDTDLKTTATTSK